MLLALEFTPDQEAQLFAATQRGGLEPPVLVQKLVSEHLPGLPSSSAAPPPYSDAKRQAAIEMLRSWAAEGESADPEEIRQANEEVQELKRNLNANRVLSGERPVFS